MPREDNAIVPSQQKFEKPIGHVEPFVFRTPKMPLNFATGIILGFTAINALLRKKKMPVKTMHFFEKNSFSLDATGFRPKLLEHLEYQKNNPVHFLPSFILKLTRLNESVASFSQGIKQYQKHDLYPEWKARLKTGAKGINPNDLDSSLDLDEVEFPCIKANSYLKKNAELADLDHLDYSSIADELPVDESINDPNDCSILEMLTSSDSNKPAFPQKKSNFLDDNSIVARARGEEVDRLLQKMENEVGNDEVVRPLINNAAPSDVIRTLIQSSMLCAFLFMLPAFISQGYFNSNEMTNGAELACNIRNNTLDCSARFFSAPNKVKPNAPKQNVSDQDNCNMPNEGGFEHKSNIAHL